MAKVSILTPTNSPLELPIVTSKVPAGFPSPAEEYLGDTLDLNQIMVDNPTATFFARVQGESMTTTIFPDDILVVDRSVSPKHGSVVVAIVNNEFTVKRLNMNDGLTLVSDNPDYEPIRITGEMDLTVWGVVTGISRKL
ncbi:hypothetical protein GCM10009123_09260 [Kangiella japonica]|uniref:Peptidase S24/S26A/S26B/S26C domain-containing protein n=1 Tax=Kangiella japonica TaxID=647384 RepID=A0ABN0SWN2_9GAMM